MAAELPVHWWKLPLSGSGTHLLRVKNIGTGSQEVLLDGTPLDAPPGTTQFTGPGASLLELQQADGVWNLLVDGNVAEAYTPCVSMNDALPPVWFKFSLPNLGTHHVRVKNIGLPGQDIMLDGTPLDAPEGTMAFTGPGGNLLELVKHEGIWVLLADTQVIHQSPPETGARPSLVWYVTLPSTGRRHQVYVTGMGTQYQDFEVDGFKVMAAPGQLTFTGPGGSLLELQQNGDSWVLLADGTPFHPSNADTVSGGQGQEVAWTFFGPTTGLAHQIKAVNIGRKGQQVYIDGNLVPGPDGQTAFTGPGGVLLELQQGVSGWDLRVDGCGLEDHNNKVTLSGAVAATGARAPVSSGSALPQGVSQDPATGKFTANIRVKGKFKFLGEFATPAEAHARYLEEKNALGGDA
mmetsp:Transcript_67665/g.201221  ORF Transcript_67665/g.201221 Transcript_67665/m.201221 type:complete len:406 (+) Transcript_67665:76-1293(+)|eukprot:CAMPEP_0175234456 /NCGR_PEP_ID=MMETSP0093-20121207/26994_1 /TAXON_ID=311494 /ORGANISM="Alexandrium monilatum, Strain CCMP3105" /LENGTH=405 /DNA_ID=CAMNT_0016528365 /DNA_START=78 /DNA_END=1295 /DNA_ORIENTATION=-